MLRVAPRKLSLLLISFVLELKLFVAPSVTLLVLARLGGPEWAPERAVVISSVGERSLDEKLLLLEPKISEPTPPYELKLLRWTFGPKRVRHRV